MLYDAYQAQQDFLAPMRAGAGLFKAAFSDTSLGPAANYMFRSFAAGAEILTRAQVIHERPPFNIAQATVAGRPLAVTEEVALDMPFGNLVHFRKESGLHQPKVLLAAPMAGHFGKGWNNAGVPRFRRTGRTCCWCRPASTPTRMILWRVCASPMRTTAGSGSGFAIWQSGMAAAVWLPAWKADTIPMPLRGASRHSSVAGSPAMAGSSRRGT